MQSSEKPRSKNKRRPFRRPPHAAGPSNHGSSVAQVFKPPGTSYPLSEKFGDTPWRNPFDGHQRLPKKQWQLPTANQLMFPPKLRMHRCAANGSQVEYASMRLFPPAEFQSNTSNDNTSAQVVTAYHEVDEWGDVGLDEEAEQSFAVSEYGITVDGDDFVARIDKIPSHLYGLIVGAQGAKKREIESLANARVNVPNRSDPQATAKGITVHAGTCQAVLKAVRLIERYTSNGRLRMAPTHFASIPLTALRDRLAAFQAEVLHTFDGTGGISAKVFTAPSRLHLTLCTLVLLGKSECVKAAAIFQEAVRSCRLRGASRIRLQGVEIMNDDPSATRIVYARVQPNDVLQNLAVTLYARFRDAGYLIDQFERDDGVKLHATLMRATTQDDAETGSGGAVMDVRALLKSPLAQFDFGEVKLDEIHLSTRYTGDDQHYYRNIARIDLTRMESETAAAHNPAVRCEGDAGDESRPIWELSGGFADDIIDGELDGEIDDE